MGNKLFSYVDELCVLLEPSKQSPKIEISKNKNSIISGNNFIVYNQYLNDNNDDSHLRERLKKGYATPFREMFSSIQIAEDKFIDNSIENQILINEKMENFRFLMKKNTVNPILRIYQPGGQGRGIRRAMCIPSAKNRSNGYRAAIL